MSQRLLIKNSKQHFPLEKKTYDCILTEKTKLNKAREKLEKDFLLLTPIESSFEERFIIFGPWKIRIGDKDVYYKFEPLIEELFSKYKQKYPSCIWFFYYNDNAIYHPNKEELINFLEKQGDYHDMSKMQK